MFNVPFFNPHSIFYRNREERQLYYNYFLEILCKHYKVSSFLELKPIFEHSVIKANVDLKCLKTSGTLSSRYRNYFYSKKEYEALERYHMNRMMFFNDIPQGSIILVAEPSVNPSIESRGCPIFGNNQGYFLRPPINNSWDCIRGHLLKLKPKIIYFRPSVFQAICESGEKFDCAVMFSDETLHPFVRQKAAGIFTKVIDKMRCWDGGLSFFECKYGRKHINDELACVENLNGVLVSTDLFNYAQPFLRYANGDYGRIEEGTCSCGIYGQYFTEFWGKRVECLRAQSGKLIPGCIATSYFLTIGESENKSFKFSIQQSDFGIKVLTNIDAHGITDLIKSAIDKLVNDVPERVPIPIELVYDSAFFALNGNKKLVVRQM